MYTSAALTTTLDFDYVTSSSLTTTLNDYVTSSGLTTTLDDFYSEGANRCALGRLLAHLAQITRRFR